MSFQGKKKTKFQPSKPQLQRFENLYIPEPNTGCWLWLGFIDDGHRYGMMEIQSNGKRKGVRAHRWAYMHFNGPIPEGYYICHKCDTPPCVNPAHLFLGTQKENLDDCIRKGRAAKACDRSNVKLREQDVLEIRSMLDAGCTQKYVADTFKVNRVTIYDIQKNRSWAWVK